MKLGNVRSVILILSVVLVGCFSIGRKFTWEQTRQLKPGMTVDEVIAVMGPPYSFNSTWMEGKRDVLIWIHSDLSGSQSLTLTFLDGRLVENFMPGAATPTPAAP